MTTNKAHDALAAEKAAAEAEGIFEPTADQRSMLKRYKVLRDRVARDNAEMEAIEKVIFSEMDSLGARALAVNGKNWVLISDTHKTVVDVEGFERDFPALKSQYAEAIAKYTSRVTVPGGRKAVKPA